MTDPTKPSKIMRKLLFNTGKRIIYRVFSYMLYILFKLLEKFKKKIYIGRIYSSRIGHLCFNAENWIFYARGMNPTPHTVFITERNVANRFILQMLGKSKGVTFLSNKWRILYSALFSTSYGRDFIIPWNIQNTDINLFSLEKSLLDLDQRLIDEFKNSIKNTYGTTMHVCFHNRDNAYLRGKNLEDNNFHDYRNFSFSEFRSACSSLRHIDICPVRIGQIVEVDKHDFEYFDLSGVNSSDLLDCIAIGSSRFLVTGNTGLSQVARLLRVPILMINYCPFRVETFHSLSVNSMILPKKIYSRDRRRYLNLIELMEVSSECDIHYRGNFFEDRKLLVIDNTEDEIKDSVLEMNARLSDRPPNCESSVALERALGILREKNDAFAFLSHKLNISISHSFLLKNEFLLQGL
jgi:putative glycosyltransferase (TIGR04372 family)